jgi:hypothetical protein
MRMEGGCEEERGAASPSGRHALVAWVLSE